jgi:predicted RNase H-like HicB family nuclease
MPSTSQPDTGRLAAVYEKRDNEGRFTDQRFVIEFDEDTDGRHIAEIPALPGITAYGATSEEAALNATIIALRVLADRLEKSEASDLEVAIVGSMFADGTEGK